MNQKYHHESNQIRYNHLIKQNSRLQQTIQQLHAQIQSISKINKIILNSHQQAKSEVITQMMRQNQRLMEECKNLRNNNQELSCKLLMNEQLQCEINNQNLQIAENYQEKIEQLHNYLRRKEEFIVCLQKKYQDQTKQDQKSNLNGYNLNYLLQVGQLQKLYSRLNIQNLQLKYLIHKKNEEIQSLNQYLEGLEKMVNKKEEVKIEKSLKLKKIYEGNKTQQRLRIQDQLAKYDKRYKQIKNKEGTSLSEAKILLAHFHQKNNHLLHEISVKEEQTKKKNREYQILKEAYKKLQSSYYRMKLQIQFYRINFKELNKATTQRKIKFYSQSYPQIVPALQNLINNRANLISSWVKDTTEFPLKFIMKKSKNSCRNRSNSCHLLHQGKQQEKPKLMDRKKEQSILSFIFQSDSILKPRQNNFQQDISQIKAIKKGYNDYEADLKTVDLNQ